MIRAYAVDVSPTLRLSDRQCEVLLEAARGKNMAEAALCLDVAPNTIKNHHTNILEQLGARNITHAVYIALKLGLIA